MSRLTRLTFCVPVDPCRVRLANLCLRQLRRTCDALIAAGVDATAVIVSDHDSLETLDPISLGFATIDRDNEFVSRRYNDAIQLATDPRYNDKPADFVVPFGSDDWADYRLFLEPLPGPDTIQGFQWISVVSEDGREIASTHWNSEGGCGIRIIPRDLLEPLDFRPCDEDRRDGCDTSILFNLRRHHGDRMKVKHMHLHDRQIVDWKSSGVQLHSYRDVVSIRRSETTPDPFAVLAEFYPAEALDEMRAHYVDAAVARA